MFRICFRKIVTISVQIKDRKHYYIQHFMVRKSIKFSPLLIIRLVIRQVRSLDTKSLQPLFQPNYVSNMDKATL